jgi:hypothetical protein
MAGEWSMIDMFSAMCDGSIRTGMLLATEDAFKLMLRHLGDKW